jgi:hypothetical protein
MKRFLLVCMKSRSNLLKPIFKNAYYLAQEIQERVPKVNQGMYRCRFISTKIVNSCQDWVYNFALLLLD